MALLATSRSGKRRRCTSSVFRVAMKLSAMALSKAVPVLPIEGTMPTSSRRLPNEIAVYWTPRSEMMHEAGNRSASPYRHLQGVDHELGSHVRGHRPTDDLARMGVQDEGQVEEAFLSWYVCDVRQPDPVGPTGHEVPAKQIRCGSSPRIATSGSTLLTPNTASEPRGSH